MSLETFFTPYHAEPCLSGQKVAVLAPHADDEVFGCGATLAALAAQGAEIHVLVISQGESNANASTRTLESTAAAAVLGYPTPTFWQFSDSKLFDETQLLSSVEQWLAPLQVDLLIAPSLWEMHRDHRAVAVVALQAMKVLASDATLAMYEVGVPLTPNTLIDITPFIAKKAQAMQCFATQLAMQSYAKQISGLNTFRSYTLDKSIEQVEAFRLFTQGQALAFDYSLSPEQHVEVLRQAENVMLQALKNNHALTEKLHIAQLLEHSQQQLQHVLSQHEQDLQHVVTLHEQDRQHFSALHEQYQQQLQDMHVKRERALDQLFVTQQERDHLLSELHESKTRLQEVYSSSSWKLTAVLRRLKKIGH
jgi:LmbE family N-acetylglucosaminyl deacetylase